MPQIPLYNKGLGSTGVTTGGSLGPRASSGAFTGGGQELAKFGEVAGNMMYEYYDADKKAEAKSAIDAAENELTLVLDKHNNEDVSTSIQQYDDTYKDFSNGKIKDIAGKYKLRPNEQKAMISKLGDLAVGIQQRGRKEASKKQDINRGLTASDSLDRNITEMSINVPGTPLYEKAKKNAEEILATSANNGILGYLKTKTLQQVNLSVEQKTITHKILSSETDVELDLIHKEVIKSKQTDTQKIKLLSNINARKNQLSFDIIEKATDQYEGNFNYEEIQNSINFLRDNEDFTITSSDGDVISFNSSQQSQLTRTKVLKIATDKLKLIEDEFQTVGASNITESTNSKDSNLTDKIITEQYNTYDNKKMVDETVITSAKGLYAQSEEFLAQGDFKSAEEKAKKVLDIVNKSYIKRPSLVNRVGVIGNTANKLKLSVAKTLIDIEEKKQYQAKINVGRKSFIHGDLDYYGNKFSEKEVADITEQEIAGKSLPLQIKLINDNNVVYKPFKSILIGGFREGLSDPDSKQPQEGYELYVQMKAIAPGSLHKHLDDKATAFYESIDVLRDVGIEMPDAVNQVKRQMTSGIEITPRYNKIKDSVDQILDTQITSFLGFTFSGNEVKNRMYVHEKVKDLTEIFIGMGTMDEETAFGKAVDHVNRSHINLAGELLPKKSNFPFYPQNETLIRAVDLAIEDFKIKNPEYAEEEIRLIPVPNRVDTWNIIVNSSPASYATNPSYTDIDLQKFIQGDRLTKINDLIQENLKNRGLTEPQQLLAEAQKLRREANQLTGSTLYAIRKEQGEDAVKSAISKRNLLLEQANDINELLNEQQRLASGS